MQQLQQLQQEGHRGLLADGGSRLQELARVLEIQNEKKGDGAGRRSSKPAIEKKGPDYGWQTSVLWALLAQCVARGLEPPQTVAFRSLSVRPLPPCCLQVAGLRAGGLDCVRPPGWLGPLGVDL